MGITDDFTKARDAFNEKNTASKEDFDAAVQKAREAGYVVKIPSGDVKRASLSETGSVRPESEFVKDPAIKPVPKKRTFLKDETNDEA